MTENICNTERILPDDWRFGFVPVSNSGHGSNFTTHTGGDHFLYGENYASEYVGPSTVRGLPAEMWKSKLDNGVEITQARIFSKNFVIFQKMYLK